MIDKCSRSRGALLDRPPGDIVIKRHHPVRGAFIKFLLAQYALSTGG